MANPNKTNWLPPRDSNPDMLIQSQHVKITDTVELTAKPITFNGATWLELVPTLPVAPSSTPSDTRSIQSPVTKNSRIEEAENWIRVQEQMPENSKAVLVWCPERQNIYTANWRVPFWYHFADGGSEKMSQMVTHWKPLPEPPAEGGL